MCLPAVDVCRHSLLTELRVLLVHGLLHLAGFDHEQGQQQLQDMAQHEASLLSELGWEGSGLISAAQAAAGLEEGSSQGEEDTYSADFSSRSSSSSSSTISSSNSSSLGSVQSVSTVSSSASSRWAAPEAGVLLMQLQGCSSV
jgi:hypothetical protein